MYPLSAFIFFHERISLLLLTFIAVDFATEIKQQKEMERLDAIQWEEKLDLLPHLIPLLKYDIFSHDLATATARTLFKIMEILPAFLRAEHC